MFIPNNVSCVTCHVSPVTCHVSHVTCHLSHVKKIFYIFFTKKIIQKKILKKMDKVVELVGGGSVINRAYPVQFNLIKAFTDSPIKLRNILLPCMYFRENQTGQAPLITDPPPTSSTTLSIFCLKDTFFFLIKQVNFFVDM